MKALVTSILMLAMPAAAALAAPPAFRQDVAWSPDGTQIAWSEFSAVEPDTVPAWNVWIATTAGTNKLRAVVNAQWVDWSPDGRRLVYSASLGGTPEVFTSRTDGTDVKRLTDGPGKNRQPAWSPKGDRIAFVSDRSGSQQVWTMRLDGANAKRVSADTSECSNPAWSADGTQLVWYARGPQGDRLWVADADGASVREVPTGGSGAIYPSFLPNGRLLYSSVTPAGRKLLTTVAPDGSDPQLVGGIESFYARASRDGRRLAFLAGAWPHSRIGIARADGVAARVLIDDPRE